MMLTSVLVSACGLGAVVALAYALCAINAMDHTTRASIRVAFVLKACGLAAQIAAAIDFVHGGGEALAWPWLLLSGVALANVGTGLAYLVNRRTCRCQWCPKGRDNLE